MKYLFIDTNVLLNFYEFSSETLEELEKLVIAIEKKEIYLAVNEQLVDEFNRRRDEVITNSIKAFTDQKIPNQFPMIVRNHADFGLLKEKLVEVQKIKEKITDELVEELIDEQTDADILILNLFDKSEGVLVSSAILKAARARVDRGNPPGKRSSLGDAIHWEILLANIPDNETLHVVSNDSDFHSKLDKMEFNKFLDDEWCNKKNSEVLIYNSLSRFFADIYPNIILAEDFEKEGYIAQLANSGSFSSTHSAIASLNKFDQFSANQVQRLVEAAVQNSQINWISADPDVRPFFCGDIQGK